MRALEVPAEEVAALLFYPSLTTTDLEGRRILEATYRVLSRLPEASRRRVEALYLANLAHLLPSPHELAVDAVLRDGSVVRLQVLV